MGVFFKVSSLEGTGETQEYPWKIIKRKGSDVGGIDWFDDPLVIDLQSCFGNVYKGETPPSLKVTVVVVWNKRQLWEGSVTFLGTHSCERDVLNKVETYERVHSVMETIQVQE